MSIISGISEYTGISFDVSTPDDDERRRGGSSRSSALSRQDKPTDATGLRLSDEEKEAVRKLQQRDREVRTHEQAHIAASGGHTVGGASYTYQRGPDGTMYAIGGHVNIDTSTESSPEATLAKARVVRAAANAPAEPSGQDRAVAARASQMEAEARQEKSEQETGRSSLGGPAALSGPPSMAGPSEAVSGPAVPLNRRVDAFGRPDAFNAGQSTPSQQNAEAADAQARAIQRQYAQTDTAAAYNLQAIAAADAAANYALAQDMLLAAQQASDAQSADLAALQNADASAAYARTLDLYALGSADASRFSNSPDHNAQQETGVSPRDAARLAPAQAEILAPGKSSPLPLSFSPPSALSQPESPTPALMEKATRVYQRMAYTPTALAPYGTGISRTI